jgi:hypothetical protein
MRRAVRLAFRMQRFELRLLLGAVLLVTAAALAIAWQTRALREEQLACYRDAAPAVEGSNLSPCHEQDPTLDVLNRAGFAAKVGIVLSPFVLGLFLGVPVVAREIEARTAPIAWSLSRSRHRWLVQRAAPMVGAVLLATLLAGAGGEVLTRAAPFLEGVDPGFEDYGMRGPLVAARGLAAVAIGIAMGALMARQLPALLLGAASVLALSVALTLANDAWMSDAVEPIAMAPTTSVTGKIYGSAIREDATGRIIEWEEYYLAHDVEGRDELADGFSMVYYMVPAARYGEFVLRESALLTAFAAIVMGGAAVGTGIRRP